jgi:hypothetical protein
LRKYVRRNGMNREYQDVIRNVSNQIAGTFLEKETELVGRALLLDADIAEITRQIGSETTEIVLRSILEQCTYKKNRKDW